MNITIIFLQFSLSDALLEVPSYYIKQYVKNKKIINCKRYIVICKAKIFFKKSLLLKNFTSELRVLTINTAITILSY